MAGSNHGGDFSERELLYKVLFDMRSDINDLKKVVYGLMPSDQREQGVMANAVTAVYPEVKSHSDKPIVIDATHTKPIEVEESLSLMDKERK